MKSSYEGIRYRVDKIFDNVTSIISIGLISPAAVALVAWSVVMAVLIIARALFDMHVPFLEEFTAYLVVLVGFLALPYTLRTGGHIKVDVVTGLLPKRVRDILGVVTTLLSLVIVAYLAHKGVLWFWYAVESKVHSEFASHILMWPVYLLVPIGLTALGLALLLELYRSVISLGKGKGES